MQTTTQFDGINEMLRAKAVFLRRNDAIAQDIFESLMRCHRAFILPTIRDMMDREEAAGILRQKCALMVAAARHLDLPIDALILSAIGFLIFLLATVLGAGLFGLTHHNS